MIDPQTEADLFRDEVLTRFHENIAAAPTDAPADTASKTDAPEWDAEMMLWAFASST